ncbi:MAG: hypothetical protein H6828_10425 [Planctomycetes bacterium]|nr:hypothetical protein [Planctomycetota bacterium]
MTEAENAPRLVPCRRTGQEYDCREHERCPYCFGSRGDVARGKHEEFCDFDPERDPVSFGFPPHSDREQHG